MVMICLETHLTFCIHVDEITLNLVTAILKIKIAASILVIPLLILLLYGFLDPENMGIATKIKPLCISYTEIWEKANLIGRHFENQDGCLNQMIQCYYYWSYRVP